MARGGWMSVRQFPKIFIALTSLVITFIFRNYGGQDEYGYEYVVTGDLPSQLHLGNISSNAMAPTTNTTMLPEQFSNLDPIKYPFREDLVKWWAYSLGDLVRSNQTKYPSEHKNHKDNVCKKYPGTIGCLYVSSPSYSVHNITLLRSIVDEVIATRKRFAIPKPNTTVIHVRLGDILKPKYTKPRTRDCFKNSCVFWPNGRQYAFPQSYYDRILKSGYLPPPNETDISVVGFVYHSNNPLGYRSAFKVSHKYRNRLVKFFENAGYSVTNLGDREPDEDFAYISYAQTFMPGQGGFSRILEEMVTENGGLTVRVLKDRG